MILLFVFILFHFLADAFASFYLAGYSFGIFDLGIIVSKMRQYISSHGGFRFVMRNHYFGASGRIDVPDVLDGLYLDTAYFLNDGNNIYHLNVERSVKGRVVSFLVVHSLFVSHLIDQLVLL